MIIWQINRLKFLHKKHGVKFTKARIQQVSDQQLQLNLPHTFSSDNLLSQMWLQQMLVMQLIEKHYI